MTTSIRARKRGPLVLEGEFEIFDAEGKRLPVSDLRCVHLCRCGASKTTPLCDGSHNRIGFKPGNED